jgi:tetratricopeptide (TPR) repeat protein
MKIRKIAVIALLVLSSFAANNVAPSKAELESMYEKAFREFDANNFGEALKQLDAIDARQPDLAESQNLRGVILMRQNIFDKAEEALRKALDLDPKFWNARFNLAEIPFLQKNWAESRDRFQKLLTTNASELQAEASQLIQYKILLTYLLEGKDNMVDSILSKFELSAETPAVQYAKAAIALHRKNPTEAKEWTATAEKNFSPALNKLFAESLYEVGWLEKPAGQTRAALELTSASERIARTKAYAKAKFEEAEQAFQQRDLATALKALDEADGHDPDQAPYLNLRGEIFLEKKDFDQAESSFRKALRVDPKFREAQYNLAQIPFKKKEYAKARERLETLFNATPGGDKNQAAQLIKFKIFLTLLLEGKESRAQKMMEQFQFTGDTPALYYAQAAWEFSHKNSGKGNDWVTSAKKIYSPALNIVFADSFYDLGWLSSAPISEAPASAAPFVAQADTSPGEIGALIEPSPIPGVSLTRPQPATELGSPGSALTLAKPPVISGIEATTSSAPPPVSVANASPVEIITAATPGQSSSSAVATQPLPSAPVATAGSQPVAGSATATEPAAPDASAGAPAAPPLVGSSSSASAPVGSAQGVPPLVASDSAAPATSLAPDQVRDYSRPSFGERLDRLANPQTLLVGALLLAGIVVLAWGARALLRPASARGLSAIPVRGRSAPIMEPRFQNVQNVHPLAPDEQRALNMRLAGGPPQVAIQLKASEPSVRRATIPVGRLARTAFPGDAIPAPVEVVENLVQTAPEETVWEVPVQESADADVLSRTAAGEVSEAFPIETSAVETATIETAPIETTSIEAASIETAPIETAPVEAAAMETAPVEAAPIETGPSDDSFGISADQEVGEVVEAEAPGEPALEPSVAPAWAAFDPDFSRASDEPLVASEIEEPAWVAQSPSFASEEVIASVESALREPAEPAALDKVEVPEPELEPIAQGQPVPYQTPAEIIEPEAEITPPPAPEGFFARAAALAGFGALRPATESASLDSPVVSTDPSIQQSTTPATMPESTITPAAPGIRIAPTAGASPATVASAAQSAVQITFSFEIASMQLTSSFKMGTLQLKPISKVVAMRLAPSQQPQPAMNLQVTFEVSAVQLAGNSLGTIRLTPSQQQKPSVITSPSFAIAGLQLVSGSESAPVQLTPSQQGQTSVHVTAAFQIATVEFSPSFEIASLILNSTSKRVSVQLPGSGPSAIEGAPVFEMTNVQLTGSGDLGMVQLNPAAAAPRRV